MASSNSKKPAPAPAQKRGRGRPPGAKNKPKNLHYELERLAPLPAEVDADEYAQLQHRAKMMLTKTPGRGEVDMVNERNTKMVMHLLRCKQIAVTVDRKDIGSLRQGYSLYIAACAENGVQPGIRGACSALGISYETLSAWRDGERKQADPRYREFASEIYADMSELREMAANIGQGNVAWHIFTAKNYDHMRDDVEITARAADPLGDVHTAEEIEEKYAQLPED